MLRRKNKKKVRNVDAVTRPFGSGFHCNWGEDEYGPPRDSNSFVSNYLKESVTNVNDCVFGEFQIHGQ